MPRTRRLVTLYCLLALFWGTSFVAIKIAVGEISPWFAAAMRMVVAVGFFTSIRLIRGQKILAPFRTLLPLWGVGLVTFGLPFSLLFWGAQKISAGLAGILNGTTPLWIAAMIYLFFPHQNKAKNKWLQIAALLLGFVGLIYIFLPRLQLSGHNDELIGITAVLAMAISYGLGNILNGLLLNSQKRKLDVGLSVYHQQISSLIYLSALSIFTESWNEAWPKLANWKIVLAIVYLGAVSTTLANIIYFYLIRHAGSVRTGTVTYWIPVVAMVLDYFILGTVPHASSLLGVLCICGGMLLLHKSMKA